MATSTLLDSYLAQLRPQGPVLVVDTAVIAQNYREFEDAMPGRVFYAVKANSHRRILQVLADLGSCFDAASVKEIQAVLDCGVVPERISYGNTILKAAEIRAALALGVRLFAVDCIPQVQKIADAAREVGAADVRVFCRLACGGTGSVVPLAKKWGCSPLMAVKVLTAAHDAGLIADGLSFHVGSEQPRLSAWDDALESCAGVFKEMSRIGVEMRVINLGGGYAIPYLEPVPAIREYGAAIAESLLRHFGDRDLAIMTEPGRALVGSAGVIRAEVVLVSKRDDQPGAPPWVYLDVGLYNGGLVEIVDIRYDIEAPTVAGPVRPYVIAGQTCDPYDIFFGGATYELPAALKPGDVVYIHGTGVYTWVYRTADFNGYPPMSIDVI